VYRHRLENYATAADNKLNGPKPANINEKVLQRSSQLSMMLDASTSDACTGRPRLTA